MLTEYQFSAARGSLTELADAVWTHYLPTIIKRRATEEILLLRPDLQRDILKSYSLKPEILTEDDGSTTMALDQLELFVNAPTKDEAIKDLANELKIYAEDYYNRIELFINSVNRRQHFPYVMRVWLCKTDDEIKSLLES